MSPEERDRLRTLEVQMQSVLDDYRDMRADQKEMKADIRRILEMVENVRGGWRVAAIIGSAGMLVGGAAVKWLPVVFK